MSDRADWQPLRDELGRWTAAGRVVRLWLRDDDAIEPTPALDRLLALSDRFSIPMALAVIPAFTGEPLAERLGRQHGVTVTVHGWAHANHAAADGKKRELGSERPSEIVLAELQQGFDRLKRLYPDQFSPVLVPPWNRIDNALLSRLPALGFQALSVYGLAKPQQPIALVNTHVDVMDWHGTRGGWPHEVLIGNLLGELRDRFDGNDDPVGVLTHHLAHDETAWSFVETLVEETAAHPAVTWSALKSFVDRSVPR
jgi:hypothetical protein